MNCLLPLGLLGLLLFPALAGAENRPTSPAVEKGMVDFRPLGDQKEIPKRYRLDAHRFPYELHKLRDLQGGGEVYELTYPSPLKSSCKENNTVHAEYYRPAGKGPFPCVIILDILAGDGRVARLEATHLVKHKIAGLYVSMPYYGARRPRGSRLRFLSYDIGRTFEAVRQTVLDLRRATAWMASRPELDARRLGIVGTSLGSFLAALTAEMEPRLTRVAVLLGGGGFVDAFYQDPRARSVVKMWEALGGTKERAAQFFAPVDPLTCAANLKGRKLLIMAGKRDEIVPPRMAEALWKASGRQRILWFDCSHYGAILYIGTALDELVKHFGAR